MSSPLVSFLSSTAIGGVRSLLGTLALRALLTILTRSANAIWVRCPEARIYCGRFRIDVSPRRQSVSIRRLKRFRSFAVVPTSGSTATTRKATSQPVKDASFSIEERGNAFRP